MRRLPQFEAIFSRFALMKDYIVRLNGIAPKGRSRQGDRTKKDANKSNLGFLPGFCSPFREKVDNELYGLLRTTNIAAHTEGDLPHPSPHFLPCI
jgi:hypothetical protein